MALADIALRAAGLRARPAALASSAPPAGALSSPTYSAIAHQPLWPAFEGPNSITLGERSLYAMRCIETIANSISGCPFVAGNMVSKTPRPTSAMQQLLGEAPGGPNPLWSAAKLWRYSIIQYLILGKFAWVHEYDSAGRIVGLWPLMAQWLVPVIAAPGGASYFESFRYGTRGARGYREFKPQDITYIWRPSQEDVRQPEAPLRLARWGIAISKLLDEFDNSFLSNGGVPAHLVITPPFEGDKAKESRTAFRNQFRRRFGGAANAGKTAFAETTVDPGDPGAGDAGSQTVDVKVIGQSQKDSQMDVMRTGRIEDMCAAFGVGISLLGVSTGSKYTNMATDRENLWRQTNSDLIRELQDAVNLALGVRMDGPKDIGWFDTSAIPEMRKPPVFSETEGLAAVAARTITVDEYRADRGMPPLPNGEGEKLIDPPKPVPVLSPVTAIGDSTSTGQPAPDTSKKPLKVVRAVRTDLLGAVRDQLAIEFEDQRSELTARLAGKRGGRKRAHAQLDLSLAYDADHWATRTARNLGPALRAAGFGQHEIISWSVDVTARVLESLSAQQAIGDVFDQPAEFMATLENGPGVERQFVEQALLQLDAGELDLSSAIGGLSA